MRGRMGWGAIVGTLLMAAWAQAQGIAPVSIAGSIVGIEGNRVAIRSDEGTVVQAEITQSFATPGGVINTFPSPPTVNVTGTEEPENLRVGQVLQITAIMAGQRSITEKVAKGTMISVGGANRLGIVSSEPVAAPANDEESDKKAPANLEQCVLAAQITAIKGELITVQYPGGKPIKFRFADDVVLDVAANDLTVTRLGDKISATGVPLTPLHMIAREVTVEHSPLPREKPGRKSSPAAVAKEKAKPKETAGANPFALGDPQDKKDPRQRAKVKLELIKVN